MRALLDVNVVLALLDQQHLHHETAREWLSSELVHGWASCAITQNGFVRVSSMSGYPNRVSPIAAIELLREACSTEHHQYWSCSASLLDAASVDGLQIHGRRQITDLYLLALAVAQGGRLVTFDRSISRSAVIGADEAPLVAL